jgi:hypothetical protein
MAALPGPGLWTEGAPVVWRLRARPRLPDAGRPLPAGPTDLDAFVREEIGIGDIEAAFERMHRAYDGQSVLRSVVML